MIKLLIVDDHQLVARCFAAALSAEPEIEVVATAYDHLQALRRAQMHRPEVVLQDLYLGAASGLDTARAIRELLPATRIIILSGFVDPRHVLEALELGVAGYLTKTQPLEEVAAAIRDVHRGRPALCPAARRIAEAIGGLDAALAPRRGTDGGDRGRSHPATRKLSHREREVLRLRARGQSIPAVARALELEPTTVRTLWERALHKLELQPATRDGYCEIPRLTDAR